MDYKELKEALNGLYFSKNGDYISTGYYLNGEALGFHISFLEDKYVRICTNEAFALWFENVYVVEREEYMPFVERICNRFGVAWSDGERCLFIKFRRNELSLAEAVTRLHAAALLCASLGHDLHL